MLFVVYAHVDRSTLGVVGQSEEDVFLPTVADEEAAQWSVPQHAMSVLHSQRTPVEAAALKLGGGVCDDLTVLFTGEDAKVGRIHREHRPGTGLDRGPLLKLLKLCVERR